jgi:pyruvate formate lyase activating enzyme
LAAWLAALSPDLPWHVSRFFPRHRQADLPPTPPASLSRARDIGLAAGLRHVYLGNVEGHSDTFCPGCRETLIRRRGHGVELDRLKGAGGLCPGCGAPIAGRGL